MEFGGAGYFHTSRKINENFVYYFHASEKDSKRNFNGMMAVSISFREVYKSEVHQIGVTLVTAIDALHVRSYL